MSGSFSYGSFSDCPVDGVAVYVDITPLELPEFEDFAHRVHIQDGTPAFSEQTLVEVRKAASARDVTQWPPETGSPASYWVYEENEVAGIVVILAPTDGSPHTIEGAVLPRFRGRGLGSALAAQVRKYVEKQGGSYHLWAHQVLGEQGEELSQRAEHLAGKLEVAPVRELRKLTLPLTAASRADIVSRADSAPLPSEVELTTFVQGQDDAAWLELNAAAFADHPEQGSLTQDDLQERVNSDWFRADGFFIARSARGLAGYHWTKIPADQHQEGEVYAVGISPEWQGKGLGRALTLAGMKYLAETSAQGHPLDAIALYVDAENTAAVSLYESLGFTPATIDIMYAGNFAPAS